MGRFFGSRIVQLDTKDRVYDDNNKLWYINLKNDCPVAFVSVCGNVIKNVYCINTSDLAELLTYITNKTCIAPSIVTNFYSDIYEECGLVVDHNDKHKNFVVIRSDSYEEEQNNVSSYECKNG